MYHDSWQSNMLHVQSFTVIPPSRACGPFPLLFSLGMLSFFLFHCSNDLISSLRAAHRWLLTTAAPPAAAATPHDTYAYIMLYVNSVYGMIYCPARKLVVLELREILFCSACLVVHSQIFFKGCFCSRNWK